MKSRKVALPVLFGCFVYAYYRCCVLQEARTRICMHPRFARICSTRTNTTDDCLTLKSLNGDEVAIFRFFRYVLYSSGCTCVTWRDAPMGIGVRCSGKFCWSCRHTSSGTTCSCREHRREKGRSDLAESALLLFLLC